MKNYIKKLKDMPLYERPREKLSKHGPEYLKNHELLSIIIGRGTKKEGVLEISKKIIDHYGNLKYTGNINVVKIQKIFDLPFVASCQITAFFELAKRLFSDKGEIYLRNPKEVFEYAKEMSRSKKEIFKGLYLDVKNRLIYEEIISVGTINASLVHPREVFYPAIKHHAVSIILVHNHPSGDPAPSEDDIKITKSLLRASKIIEIEILDHLIIGNEKYFSLRERGII
jgi:DNA repair protein RadC